MTGSTKSPRDERLIAALLSEPTVAAAARTAGIGERTARRRLAKRHLVETLDLFRHLGVEFVSLRESIDIGSPFGQALFTIIAAIAQLERSLIGERVRAGLRRAKAEGKRLGRPRVEVDQARLESVIRRQLSVREAARELGISASSFARLMRGRYAIGTIAGHSVPSTIHDPTN